MPIIIRQMENKDRTAWDAFVLAHAAGTFCHRAGWKSVIERGVGQKCPYLLAEREGQVVGVLPLTARRSWLFGNALISTMFGVYGGPLADDADVLAALESAAWGIANSEDLGQLKFRTVKAQHHSESGWVADTARAATFIKPLAADDDALLLDIPRKQHAVVRKSLKSELTCTWETDVDTFYQLYSVSVRNLGTPVFPKKMFVMFLEEFGEDVSVQVIRTPSGEPVASLLSFYHGQTVLPYYAGGTTEARRYGAHDFMYYKLMCRAVGQGYSLFDFGRSKDGTGPFKFKRNWGFTPTFLEYETKTAAGVEKKDVSPTNKKFELMVTVWKKLPLPVANFIGPFLSRHLG